MDPNWIDPEDLLPLRSVGEIKDAISELDAFLAHGDKLSPRARTRTLQVKHTLRWMLNREDGPVGRCTREGGCV